MVEVSNLRRAAVLLMSLPEDEAATLLSRLTPRQVEAVSIEIAKLGAVSAEEQTKAIKEFTQANPKSLTTKVGGLNIAQQLVNKALGDSAKETLNNLRQSVEALPFGFLKKVDPQNIQSYVVDEHPQTIAVVLSRIRAEQSARVLSVLPETLALDVINRLIKMDSVQKDVLERVEQTLRTEFMSTLSQTSKRDPYAPIAEIFNYFDRQTENRFFVAMEATEKESAERIKTLMFTFDDLVKLDSGAIQTILRKVDKNKLTIALKGASEAVRDYFLKNMSQRAAKLMTDDLQNMGPVRLKEVDEAQALMITTAKDLADKGEIVIVKGASAEDELVY
ncbi:MAG TPA: flagellar motor switch protein FliG [Planctomycetaceae bacterium]|nr:flagellar motor switch protein FliG [Planctomycetaceae bacterium]